MGTWLDLATVLLMLALTAMVCWFGFSHLTEGDARETKCNREDACLSHAWARVAGAGLVCQLCGKVPGR